MQYNGATVCITDILMPFSFKQFHIDDSHCGMPVSTDGVLLGAWAPLTEASKILDIGAGSGLLSLMAAQRSKGIITAIELDHDAAIDCSNNIDTSPWASRITLVPQCINQWLSQPTQPSLFDHIVCNPPYFDNGPQAATERRALARHTQSLSFQQLLEAIKTLLHPEGRASLILPTQSLKAFLSQLSAHQLTLIKRVDVASIEGKIPHRHLLLLGHQEPIAPHSDKPESLCIRDRSGKYTQEMVALTKAFYLKL
ncbi:tRNA1(Val) (adenine(37)-N6)-methyltransferase [Shewanella algidipiscicola]|uniref:tRNA1(Val) (adenine(37)-N6)-methyltransferase n=2 Tax=Shewanella algidipiscicola TaxID=614070 RepID=A0ABQ4PK03_9GAMM|nr:tRNA1(Val) (adenine(37)-N6)-methyltransferase [Shewanella algidipiscicola]